MRIKLKKHESPAGTRGILVPGVTLVRTKKEAKKALDVLMRIRKKPIGADTETDGVNPREESPVGHGRVICFTLYAGKKYDFGSGPRLWVSNDEDSEGLIYEFQEFFESDLYFKVWHNYGFDRHVIANHGITCGGFAGDTMHMVRLHDAGRDEYSLEACTEDYLGRRKRPMRERFGVFKPKKNGEPSKQIYVPTPLELQRNPKTFPDWVDYATYDTEGGLYLYREVRDRLKEMVWTGNRTMWDYYQQEWLPLGKLLTEYEHRGITVDAQQLSEIQPVAEKAKAEREYEFKEWASQHCPEAVHMNIGSPAQLQVLLFGGSQNEKTGERIPTKRTFQVDNVEGYIKPGRKKPNKKRDIVLTRLPAALEPVEYTKTGAPGTGGDTLLVFAGDVSEKARAKGKERFGKAFEAFADDPDDKDDEAGKEACYAFNSLYEAGKIDTLLTNFIVPLQRFPDKNGRIHPSINFNTETGRFSIRKPSCFDGKTEILTKRGWVRFDELKKTDLVAQWDKGDVTFVRPTAYVNQEHVGHMVHVENKQVDLFMTPDHRCLQRNRKNGRLSVVKAEDYRLDAQQLHGGHWHGGSQSLSAPLVALLCAAQADGSWSRERALDFSLSKPRKIKRLKWVLQSLGILFEAKEQKYLCRGVETHRTRFYVRHELIDWVYDQIGPEKLLGDWLLDYDHETLTLFSEEFFFWDGCWKNKSMYASEHSRNADWVQTVCLLVNQRAKVRAYQPSEQAWGSKTSWQVDRTYRDSTMTSAATKRLVPYSGRVYCVSVPSSFIIVRRNGKAAVTGNCQNQPTTENDRFGIRDCYTVRDFAQWLQYLPEDEREEILDTVRPRENEPTGLIVADFSQLELRILAHLSNCESMKKAFASGFDFHSFTAMMFDEVRRAVESGKVTIDDDGSGRPTIKDAFPVERGRGKTVNFSIAYGKTVVGFAKDWHTTEREAQKVIDAWYSDRPEVLAWQQATIARAYQTGFTRTLGGRYRPIPELRDARKGVRRSGERKSINTPIQGGAADVVNRVMLLLDRDPWLRSHGFFGLLQVHDEIVLEGPWKFMREAKRRVKAIMESPFSKPLRVPLVVSIDHATSWAQAK